MASAVAQAQAAVTAAQVALNAANAAVTAARGTLVQRQTALAAAQTALRMAKNVVQRNAAGRAVATAQTALTAAQAALVRAQTTASAAGSALAAKQAALAALQAAAAATTVTAPLAPSATPGLKRALLVGINYVGTSYELYGCINDAKNMMAQLQGYFPMCRDYRLITDETPVKPTKANIMAAIDWLVTGLQPGENVMFHYAGHGGRVRDKNGDEVTGLDSCIYPVNGGRMETIIDDELRAALASRIPAGSKCLVVLDCCHSGTAVDLRCQWQAISADKLVFTENQRYPKTAGSVLFLSGCRDTQTAADTVGKDDRPCGAMTMALLETWKAYGAGIKLKYLLWDVRKFLRDYGYSQVPELTTGAFMDMNGVFDLGTGTL
jgi:hypothetical protein